MNEASFTQNPFSFLFIHKKRFILNALSTVKLPANLTAINDSAFQGCSSLGNISIPDSVTTIGANAFNGCIMLREIRLPDSLQKLDISSFQNCRQLTGITWKGTTYSSIEDAARAVNGNS